MTVDNSVDTSLINESLQRVAKGAGIVFVGTIIGTILGFMERVLIARYYTQAQYGVFSLALVLLNIFAVIATLGLQEGVARQIAYYGGKGDDKKVRGIIISSIEIALIASIILSSILFLGSNFISTKIFHESLLSPVIKIFSVTLPFFVLINIFVAIARGFNDVKPKVYFQNILRNVLFISLLIAILWLGLSFLEVIYAFLFSIIISCILLAIYIVKKVFLSVEKVKNSPIFLAKKELLFFSLPLLAFTVLSVIMNWTDTLMLGYFKSSSVVGLYNAAFPLAQLIPMTLASAAFLYTPIISELYSKNLIKEIGRTYQILTKWIFSFTLPIFFILFLFSETILKFIFGINYIPANLALRILCLGLMLHVFLGLNGLTLMVIGKTRFLMITSLIAAILNVALNAVFIPKLSIEGAAIASLSAYCTANILNSAKLYQLSKIHPFTWNYLKPIGISIFLLTMVYIFTLYFKISLWMLPVFLFVFLFSYFILLLLTKSFDKEDIELLFSIEKRIGKKVGLMEKIKKKFV